MCRTVINDACVSWVSVGGYYYVRVSVKDLRTVIIDKYNYGGLDFCERFSNRKDSLKRYEDVVNQLKARV